MNRILLATLVVAVVACGGARDQKRVCERAFQGALEHKLEPCIREGWTDKRIDCEQRTGGGLGSLFCGDDGGAKR